MSRFAKELLEGLGFAWLLRDVTVRLAVLPNVRSMPGTLATTWLRSSWKAAGVWVLRHVLGCALERLGNLAMCRYGS